MRKGPRSEATCMPLFSWKEPDRRTSRSCGEQKKKESALRLRLLSAKWLGSMPWVRGRKVWSKVTQPPCQSIWRAL